MSRANHYDSWDHDNYRNRVNKMYNKIFMMNKYISTQYEQLPLQQVQQQRRLPQLLPLQTRQDSPFWSWILSSRTRFHLPLCPTVVRIKTSSSVLAQAPKSTSRALQSGVEKCTFLVVRDIPQQLARWQTANSKKSELCHFSRPLAAVQLLGISQGVSLLISEATSKFSDPQNSMWRFALMIPELQTVEFLMI